MSLNICFLKAIHLRKSKTTEFKRGRISLQDDGPSGHPKTTTIDDNITQVYQMVLNYCRIKIRDIAKTMNMSKECICYILNQDLSIRKLFAALDAVFAYFRRNKSEFLRRLITVDDTWIHHYNREIEILSKQWTAKGDSALKEAKTVFSAEKMMATVFWDIHGVILIDLFQKAFAIAKNPRITV
ncbi:uncharacterized protein LOC118441852 [Vespa mandarinia]|uniref:uncharacterized protein LOC118441852 n=1 Tax=Vespa mandarinia TaxID=7446 RepID=UPI00161C856A|nr:uncharacterized protein LOC118441852 [Vespa mandarinia]